MQKALTKLLLYLLRKVSREEWKRAEQSQDVSKNNANPVSQKTIVTIDADGPGVVMKIYDLENEAYQLLEELMEDINSSYRLLS